MMSAQNRQNRETSVQISSNTSFLQQSHRKTISHPRADVGCHPREKSCGDFKSCAVRRTELCRYRFGWLRNRPAVGQSFPAERLGISLTRRLPTPPPQCTDSTSAGPLISRSPPGPPSLFLSTPLFSTARHRTLPTLRLPLLLSIYSSGGRLGHQSGESLLPHSAGVGTREVAVA
jgi:hypothetical protein